MSLFYDQLSEHDEASAETLEAAPPLEDPEWFATPLPLTDPDLAHARGSWMAKGAWMDYLASPYAESGFSKLIATVIDPEIQGRFPGSELERTVVNHVATPFQQTMGDGSNRYLFRYLLHPRSTNPNETVELQSYNSTDQRWDFVQYVAPSFNLLNSFDKGRLNGLVLTGESDRQSTTSATTQGSFTAAAFRDVPDLTKFMSSDFSAQCVPRTLLANVPISTGFALIAQPNTKPIEDFVTSGQLGLSREKVKTYRLGSSEVPDGALNPGDAIFDTNVHPSALPANYRNWVAVRFAFGFNTDSGTSGSNPRMRIRITYRKNNIAGLASLIGDIEDFGFSSEFDTASKVCYTEGEYRINTGGRFVTRIDISYQNGGTKIITPASGQVDVKFYDYDFEQDISIVEIQNADPDDTLLCNISMAEELIPNPANMQLLRNDMTYADESSESTSEVMRSLRAGYIDYALTLPGYRALKASLEATAVATHGAVQHFQASKLGHFVRKAGRGLGSFVHKNKDLLQMGLEMRGHPELGQVADRYASGLDSAGKRSKVDWSASALKESDHPWCEWSASGKRPKVQEDAMGVIHHPIDIEVEPIDMDQLRNETHNILHVGNVEERPNTFPGLAANLNSLTSAARKGIPLSDSDVGVSHFPLVKEVGNASSTALAYIAVSRRPLQLMDAGSLSTTSYVQMQTQPALFVQELGGAPVLDPVNLRASVELLKLDSSAGPFYINVGFVENQYEAVRVNGPSYQLALWCALKMVTGFVATGAMESGQLRPVADLGVKARLAVQYGKPTFILASQDPTTDAVRIRRGFAQAASDIPAKDNNQRQAVQLVVKGTVSRRIIFDYGLEGRVRIMMADNMSDLFLAASVGKGTVKGPKTNRSGVVSLSTLPAVAPQFADAASRFAQMLVDYLKSHGVTDANLRTRTAEVMGKKLLARTEKDQPPVLLKPGQDLLIALGIPDPQSAKHSAPPFALRVAGAVSKSLAALLNSGRSNLTLQNLQTKALPSFLVPLLEALREGQSGAWNMERLRKKKKKGRGVVIQADLPGLDTSEVEAIDLSLL